MRGKIKSSEFMQFDFWTTTNAQTSLECSYDFKPQYPEGTSDKVLAIMVIFQAKAPDDVVHFNAKCRVVFDFSNEDSLPSGDKLIESNYRAAYQEFCEKANEALTTLGQNRFNFQEI